MIRVLMFDLGETLIDAQKNPLPHVRTALTAIAGFRTAAGKPLASCLVSDYTMVPPPLTSAKMRPVFDEYLRILAAAGLRTFFEPVARRVTLSTHAGATKPAAAVFEKALSRLHIQAALTECLLVTENAAHVAAVRKNLGMQALHFRTSGVTEFDFDDWSQAPALIAERLGRTSPANLHAAVRAHLSAQGVEVDELPGDAQVSWPVSGRRWHPVKVPKLGTVHVALPVRGSVTREAGGRLVTSLPAPDAAEIAEAGAFARSLARHDQIAADGGARGGATHALEMDDQGRRKLVRRRFSAM